MELYKKAERTLKMSDMVKNLKAFGYQITNIGTYKKWKDLKDGSRLSVSITIRKGVDPAQNDFYLVEDTLGRVACPVVHSYNEVKEWLKEHGYKPEKAFYLEDYGMTEETWNEWNGIGTEEE